MARPVRRPIDEVGKVAAANRRRARAIAGVPAVVVLLVGVLVGGAASALVAGVVAGIVAGAVAGGVVRRAGRRVLLRGLGARLVDEDDVPRAATLVEGLCASMGLALPEIRVVDDLAPNALALGTGPSDAVLVLTSGLLSTLDPVALEGVLAHELAHVKRDDVAPATAAALLAYLVPMPGSAELVHRLAGRGREFATDQQAVSVTRYPPGLRHGLDVIAGPLPAGGSAVAGRRAGQATRWLWTALLPDPAGHRPTGDDAVGELDVAAVRVAALDEW